MPPKKSSSPARTSSSTRKGLGSKSLLLMTALATLVLLVIIVRCYRKKNRVKTSASTNRSNCGMNNETLYFFYADWCPHCKKAMPEMHDFEAYAKKTFPGKKVKQISIVDPVEPEASIISCLNVTSVPTVFFVGKSGRFQKMNVACTFQNLKEMAHKMWA